MNLSDALRLVRQNVGRNPKHYLFAAVGIVVGVGMLSFFVALGLGVRARVLNTYFPANQIELEPRRIGVLGVEGAIAHEEVTEERLNLLRGLAGVSGVFPSQRSRFQARLWGGAGLFGRDAHAEAFFDGIAPELIREDLRTFELGTENTEPTVTPARGIICDTSEDCPAGFDCDDAMCLKHELWTDFRSIPVATRCRSQKGCPADHACHKGFCRSSCSPENIGRDELCMDRGEASTGARFQLCESDEDCGAGLACSAAPCSRSSQCGEGGACVGGRCSGFLNVCDFLKCRYSGGYKDQDRENPEAMGGVVIGRCLDSEIGGESESGAGENCEPVACPEGSYCAGDNATADEGICQAPLPVVLNPFLVDAFNATAASALNLSRIADPRILLGLNFRMRFGDSFFIRGEKRSNQITRRIMLVGFSDKAPMLGVSLPLNVVQHANAAYRGRSATTDYDAVIIVTNQNEDMSEVIREAEGLGFTLAPRSREARKLSNMLLILTLVFALISVIIMGIAVINIAHIFLMIVAERRREIGILRALGATGGDVRTLILIEAALVGFVGAIFGHLGAYALGGLTNHGIHAFLDGWMRLPKDFFVFDVRLLALSVLGAVLVAMLGAWTAAKRASSLDPARVLSEL